MDGNTVSWPSLEGERDFSYCGSQVCMWSLACLDGGLEEWGCSSLNLSLSLSDSLLAWLCLDNDDALLWWCIVVKSQVIQEGDKGAASSLWIPKKSAWLMAASEVSCVKAPAMWMACWILPLRNVRDIDWKMTALNTGFRPHPLLVDYDDKVWWFSLKNH